MLLTPMRYKDYTWPHNPTTYSITYERQVALHKVPFGRYYMQDLGQSCRVMRGEGVFYGEGAYAEFKKLGHRILRRRTGPADPPRMADF